MPAQASALTFAKSLLNFMGGKYKSRARKGRAAGLYLPFPKGNWAVNKILVVDDNGTNRKLLRVILKSIGYETIEAEDGQQGVELARDFRPALIIMDIQMPVLSGNEALKILKADQATAEIPVVALTSYAMSGDKEKFLGKGFDSYIAKPVEQKKLLDTIKSLLKKNRHD